ncbi:putative RNA-directed DNA polymerase from transposon X-element [Trichonephila clavipes]|nr:putative RNA-directed DNA polymerase from transposon X-element [Trichonephila clavipes]
MSKNDDFPALEPPANSVSEPLSISMDTEPHPPSPEDLAKCTRMLDTHEYLMVKEAKLIQTNHYLMMVRTGILRKNQTTYDSMMKEADNHTMEIKELRRWQLFSNLKKEQPTRRLCHARQSSEKAEASAKLLFWCGYTRHYDKPVSSPDWKRRVADAGPHCGASCHPQDPPIHLKFADNYNLIMQEINRNFPKTRSKLSGEYLLIFASTSDDHRDITLFLKEKGEQFFAFHPIDLRPQKIVIKGLPISTDICDIQKDLTERGFLVNKVAQLTKTKTKFKLPIFMVELQKSPDSPDIFKLERCCYLNVKIDTFNRRPGPTQCYNCNLFNHSSQNCFIKTRCLKCGEPHKTGDCPITDKIENPTCINCGEKGHLANSHRYTRFDFPKRNISTDWELFRELLSPAHFSFKPITALTGEDVETQVSDLTNTILNTHALSSKPIKNRNTHYVTNDIKTLTIERNRARKTWQFTRNPNDKRVLNNLQNRLRRQIKAFQNKNWENDLRSLDPDDGSLWDMSKELRNKKTPVYALKGRTGIANTDSEKAEVLASSLETQFQENNITNHTDYLINRIVENYFLNENNFDVPPLPPPMPSEIINYIKKTKIKRAPGREGITNKILQNLTLPVIFQITNIISNIFSTGHFPNS